MTTSSLSDLASRNAPTRKAPKLASPKCSKSRVRPQKSTVYWPICPSGEKVRQAARGSPHLLCLRSGSAIGGLVGRRSGRRLPIGVGAFDGCGEKRTSCSQKMPVPAIYTCAEAAARPDPRGVPSGPICPDRLVSFQGSTDQLCFPLPVSLKHIDFVGSALPATE